MKLRSTLFLLVLGISATVSGQTFKVTGKIANTQLEPLAFASVEVRATKIGTISKEDGSYELELEEGQYEIIVSMIGYQGRIVSLVVNKNLEQNFILELDEGKDLGAVIVKAKVRDRAEEIMRKLIDAKDSLKAAAGNYSSDVYIKATQQQDLFLIKGSKSKPDTVNVPDPNVDLTKMAMAEVSLRGDHGSGSQYKEERLGVTKRGDVRNLFYLTLTDGDFNLYNNHIKAPTVSAIPFISPVSYSGLVAYRFKTLKRERVGKYWIYTISVRPRQLSNATIEGEITISDSSLSILHAKYTLPSYHVPEYDFFEIEQHYNFVDQTAWMITRQKFTYYSKYGKGKQSGETVAVFRDFDLNKKFNKGHFGNEVSITSVEAYQKDSAFWNNIRTEPLSAKELRFIQYKDSIHQVMTSEKYLDSLDEVMNRVTWKNVLFLGQSINDHKKERRILLPPIASIIQLFQFGGTRINLSMLYSKTYPTRKNINFMVNSSFGIRNKDVNGSMSFERRYNPFSGGAYTISAGRDFHYIFEGDAWVNMLRRSNIYLNNSVGVAHALSIFNGLHLNNGFEIAFRRSVADYKTNPRADSLFGGNNQPVSFAPYNALYSNIRLAYTPKQRYLREPREKIILGSKWPTVYVFWRKGMPGFLKSQIDFDYLEYGLEQKLKFGVLGNSEYRVKTGSFTNKKDLRIVDYKYMRRGDPLLFSSPHKSFQALDSTFALFDRFYEGHIVHEFNGFFLNKIPLFKKLQLREVAGAGFLFAPERELKYVEAFVGIERVVKWPFNPLTKFKLGVYVVGSAANSFRNPVQFKVSLSKWDWLRNKWL